MSKHLKLFLSCMVFVFIFALSGCRGKQQTDADNKYKLPLGDSGYYSELNFALCEDKAIKQNENGEDVEWIQYEYVTANTEYTITVTAKTVNGKKTDFEGKSIRLTAGYYNEDEFVPYNEGKFVTLSTEQAITDTYSFTTDSNYKDAVVKLEFGTFVDEKAFKVSNPNAKKSEIRKATKKYRGCEFIFNTLSLGNQTLLEATSTANNAVGKVNSDLKYYNTATVAYEYNTLMLKLNYKGGAWQWIIKMFGYALFELTKLVGGYYWLGVLIFTILLRTIAWPIYAKTNSYSTKMAAIQPEMEKINKKYEGKTDQNSKMKQQMEMRALMKKNHVSMFGCLLPFIQMPIFFIVYQVVMRFPLTPIYTTKGINFNFLWTTFASDYGQTTGDPVLAIVVGVTMIGSQILTMYLQKRAQRKKQNFYTAQSQQNNSSMIIMMVFMTIMMVVFAWGSAGMAFYWIIGNVYQIAQTFISKVQEEKKLDKELRESGRVRGRY